MLTIPTKPSNHQNSSPATSPTSAAISNDQAKELITAKRHRNRPDLANFGEENVQPGDNARYLRYALVSLDLPPIDISDEKQVENRIREYFEFCIENDRKPNMKGMANWLGISRETVNSWKRGDYRTETHSAVIKKACDILEELWIEYGQNGKTNPAAWIFLGKNMFGYKDIQDVVVTPNTGATEAAPVEEIEDYLASTGEVIE